MRRLLSGIVVVVAALSIDRAAAQTYPSRPITLIVPFAPGGPTDVLARILAERMRISLGQPIIIENVTGAGGTISVNRTARANPDGYTLGIGNWSTHVLNGAVYSLQIDLLKDLEPVALLANNPELIVSRRNFPASDLQELIQWMKRNPDKATAGSGGGGSHVAAVLFQNLTSTKFHIAFYRGAAPVMQDLVGEQIDLFFDQASSALPHVRTGKIKAFAVTANSRLPSAPEIPTVDEAGLPGFFISIWHALWAPKDTPREIVSRLNVATREALADPNIGKRLAELGQEIPSPEQQSPQALAAFHKNEIDKWWPIIKAANIKAN
jgi:tripartite-type tricarboxylate transporter receptor subunit TctC